MAEPLVEEARRLVHASWTTFRDDGSVEFTDDGLRARTLIPELVERLERAERALARTDAQLLAVRDMADVEDIRLALAAQQQNHPSPTAGAE